MAASASISRAYNALKKMRHIHGACVPIHVRFFYVQTGASYSKRRTIFILHSTLPARNRPVPTRRSGDATPSKLGLPPHSGGDDVHTTT